MAEAWLRLCSINISCYIVHASGDMVCADKMEFFGLFATILAFSSLIGIIPQFCACKL